MELFTFRNDLLNESKDKILLNIELSDFKPEVQNAIIAVGKTELFDYNNIQDSPSTIIQYRPEAASSTR